MPLTDVSLFVAILTMNRGSDAAKRVNTASSRATQEVKVSLKPTVSKHNRAGLNALCCLVARRDLDSDNGSALDTQMISPVAPQESPSSLNEALFELLDEAVSAFSGPMTS
jgi:hypothetical protein